MAAIELENHYIYGSHRIGINKNSDKTKMNRQNIHYELTNHLGNVMATIRGAKIQNASGYGYRADIVSTTTYGVFGNTIEEWSSNSTASKFAFNGKENIEEIDGWQDYGMRMYNRLIGRFPSPDPLIVYKQQYPELSSYQFASNTPIAAIDLDGLEAEIRVWNMDRGTYISHQVPKEKQIGDGILNLYYRTNNKGEYKLYSVWYIQSWTEWWENSGSKTIWNVIISDNWGVHLWGSSDGSKSPGRKTSADKIIGDFDISAYFDLLAPTLQGLKTKKDNTYDQSNSKAVKKSIEGTTTAVKKDNEYKSNDNSKKPSEEISKTDTIYTNPRTLEQSKDKKVLEDE